MDDFVKPYDPEAVQRWMDDQGRYAYEEYAKHANWTTYDGRAMPEWGDLTEAVQGHWSWVAMSVRAMVVKSEEEETHGA